MTATPRLTSRLASRSRVALHASGSGLLRDTLLFEERAVFTVWGGTLASGREIEAQLSLLGEIDDVDLSTR